MARILLSHQSPILHMGNYEAPAFYEGFIDTLLENGNDILHLISNDFLLEPWNGTNLAYSNAVREDIHEQIKLFNPDLVIIFNNSTIEGIEKLVNCPICLWNADTVTFFNDKESVLKNTERYIYLATSDHCVQDYINVLSVPKELIHKMRFATAIHAQKNEQDYNISFIGSNFKIPSALGSFLQKNPESAKSLIRLSRTGNAANLQKYINDHRLNKLGIKADEVNNIMAGEQRIQILCAVAPLGLHLFGDQNWSTIFDQSIDAFLGFNPHLVYTVSQNSLIYNRSKVGISITHSQSVTGYPWRVPDVMASNAVLVSDKRQDLINDFGDSVPLQLYETPMEAYDIIVRLLKEKNLRDDIVSASQAAIEAGFRWKHRLKDIEEITGVSILNMGAKGTYKRYKPHDDVWKGVAEYLYVMINRKEKENNRERKIKRLWRKTKSYLPRSLYFHLFKKAHSRVFRELYK